MRASRMLALTVIAALVGCSDDTGSGAAGAGGDTSSGAGNPGSGAATSTGGGGQAQGGNAAGGGEGGQNQGAQGPGGGGQGQGGAASVPDPNLDGPFATMAVSGSTTVAATGNMVAISGFAPSSGGPFPVVVIGHGFQLPTTQYEGYAQRLASFGYVALLPDFPTSFFGISHVEVARDMIGAIDWAATNASVSSLADTTNVGMTGHSLGGKGALLAATYDARVKAVIALDPVDSSMNCSPADCPDVSALMPSLNVPTGFLGETTDASGGFQPCAPAADNFTTFYAGANSPSFQVTVNGANHMSFLDDVASCGFTCSFCNAATAPNAEVNGMSKAYVAAFFERYLRDIGEYDAYLTGDVAIERYVTPGKATIVSK
jgi:dienelactone hydrolase